MTITFEENYEITTWDLSPEDYRLLDTLRQRLTVERPPTPPSRERTVEPRFATVAEMIHTHLADSLLLDQIRVEAQETAFQTIAATISEKRSEVSVPVKGGRPVLRAAAAAPDTFGSAPIAAKTGILDSVKSFFS